MDPILETLTQNILQLLPVKEILLFNEKRDPQGALTAIKLCIVLAAGDPQQAEGKLYTELESELPFDLLVYSREEWQSLLNTPYSFAGRICKTGRVLYEAN